MSKKRIRGGINLIEETKKFNFFIISVDVEEPEDESKWRLVCRGREEGYDTEAAATQELNDCMHRIETKLAGECDIREPWHAPAESMN